MEVRFTKIQHPWQYDPFSDAPLGFLSVAAVAREIPGVNVSWSDMPIDISSGNFTEFAQKIPGADIYALSASTLEMPGIIEVAEEIKKSHPKSKIIVGGPHFDSFSKKYWEKEIQKVPFDVVTIGEGEANIRDAIEAATMDRGKKVIAQGRPFLNIESLPNPARDLLDSKKYFGLGKAFAGGIKLKGSDMGNSTTIMVSRGCPNACSFCASPYFHDRTVRFRSLSQVREELELLKEEYGVSQLRWHDDNFQLNLIKQKGLEGIMEEMEFSSRVSARTDYIARHPEALAVYRKAGIKEIGYGIESVDDGALEALGKSTTVANHRKALQATKDAGIRTRLFLITGLPGETEDTSKHTIDFLEDIKPEVVTLMNFVPMPGSDIFRNPGKYGVKTLTDDWKKYNIGITREFQKFPFVHELSTISREGMVRNLENLKEYIFTKGISNVPIYNSPYKAQKSSE